ncbi:fasciclin domain-containing protein [Armatimonas sp.]|uniref:fasciclin domain-containing protein n=1 Tax=Armatimonas sp. TaxID=1872638 RepID=UPI0037528D24
MKYQKRALRVAAALTLTGFVASQIPMRGQTALGSVRPPGSVQPADGYLTGNTDNSGSFLGIRGLTNRNAITGIALGLLGFGAYSTILDSRAISTLGGAAGAAGGAGNNLNSTLLAGAANKPIYDVLKSMPSDFVETVKLVDDAELVTELREGGPYTFLAPTNSCLTLDSAALIKLHAPENKPSLISLIKRHTVKGRYKISDLLEMKDGATVENLLGDKLTISNKNGTLMISNILVAQNDIAASNGWIHPIEAPIEEQ